MKLMNRKTGKIGNFCYGPTEGLCVAWQKDDGFWDKKEYSSLAELNAEWEDVPEEPKQHWFITTDGRVLECNEDACWSGEKEIGNYFESEEEAERAVEKLKAWERLKDKGIFIYLDHTDFQLQEGSFNFEFKNHDFLTNEEMNEADKDLDILFGGEK